MLEVVEKATNKLIHPSIGGTESVSWQEFA